MVEGTVYYTQDTTSFLINQPFSCTEKVQHCRCIDVWYTIQGYTIEGWWGEDCALLYSILYLLITAA